MAGSPVFKFKPTSSKKLKANRKLSLQNVNENKTKAPHQFPVTEPKPNSSNQCPEAKNESSGIQDVTNRTEPNKSISSSLSSFVFPSKKCAKRKLNFDVDGDTDDLSSLRFSDKNLSLCGFRSKTSSITDQRSLPDVRNVVQSPNKNRTRFSGSYRSSVGSVISCRRKLFGDFEPEMKKPKLSSPVLCQKTKSNKKEIKLSLKKKFPGVPNSDSARSGLLLNLAFSKYNLSNSKQEDVSVGFVDNAGCTTTKKDFVHYSQIKQDESSRCRSPVFMAIKKVKRKLNLEDQCSLASNKSVESNADNLNGDESKDETPAVEVICEKQNVPKSDLHSEAVNVVELVRENHSVVPDPKPRNYASSTTNDIVKERRDFKRHDMPAKAFTPFSPIIAKQSGMGNESSSMQKLNIAKCKNNLFKNSKIRSILRDKIFDLSEINANRDKKVSNETHGNKSLMENSLCRNQTSKLGSSENICERDAAKQNSSSDYIFESQDTVRKPNPSSKKICTKNLHQQKHTKKWINRDSFDQLPTNSHFKLGNTNTCDQRFLKSHMNRFLTDCLTFSGQIDDFDNEDVPDAVTKNAQDEVKVNQGNETVDKKNSTKLGDFTIENVDSQEDLAKSTSDRVKSRLSKLTIDKKKLKDKQANFSFENLKSRDEIEKNPVTGMITDQNEPIIDDETPNNERTDFTIENIDSQEEIPKKICLKAADKLNQLMKDKKSERSESRIKTLDFSEAATPNTCDKTKTYRSQSITVEDPNNRTESRIKTLDFSEAATPNTCDRTKTYRSRSIIDDSPNNHEKLNIKNVDSIEAASPDTCDKTKTYGSKWIIGESPKKREDFTIENIDSQDDIVIENIDSQREPVNIEPIESQTDFIPATINPMETDVNLLLLESQQYTMSIGLKDCILKKSSTKVCKSVNTDVGTSSVIDEAFGPQISCANSQKDVFESCSEVMVSDADMKIEQVSTSASYSCVQFTDKKEEKSTTPDCKNADNISGILETTKKTKRKSIPNTLTYRLNRLLNREKSDFRMWEYEMSRSNVQSDPTGKPAVFCIEKMWKEYSHIILLCSYFYKDNSDYPPCEFTELKSFAKDISNSIVIILEQDSCPKNLSYSSVFQIYPPWKLLNFDKCAPLVMLKPRKISIISTNENPIMYKDPTIPNSFIVTKQRELCSCGDICCDCGIPNSYQFLIEPLLLPDLSFFSQKNFSYHHFDIDTFSSRCITDVLMKHKIFSTRDLSLDVQILHCHKDESIREFSFWYFICSDEKKNLCCLLTETKTDKILPYVDKESLLRFTGLSPCKLIPSKNVMIFLQYLNFTNIPDDVEKVIDSQSIVVFLLSNEYGNVECID